MYKKSVLLGAHMSIAGGFARAIERGESIGCTCIQIFTKSNQQWHAKALDEQEVAAFKQKQHASAIKTVIVHASYLINIGSDKEEIYKKSVAALAIELQRCHALNIPYLVLHPGSRGESTLEECLQQISAALDSVLEENPGKTMILLENTAGQGSSVGNTFEQLATIRKHATHKTRIGFCFDTCHAFAAGYDFTDTKKYHALWRKFDEVIGLTHLKAMHLNDSKKECDSHVDRHEFIGKGKLGLETFSLIMNDPHLEDVPKILETPANELADYRLDMDILEKLLKNKNKSGSVE